MLRLAILAVAACGAGAPASHDAPGGPSDSIPVATDVVIDVAIDAAVDAPVDAMPCTTIGPVGAKHVQLDNVTLNHPLVLDGVGTRCEQLQRAILDPAQRPAVIQKLDASTGLQPPLCTEFAQRTNVNIDITGIAGRRLLSQGQYLRVWVDNATDTLEQIRIGWFLEPPAELPNSCVSTSQTEDAVVDYQQEFRAFQLCAPYADGTWTVYANDTRTMIGDGLYVREGKFHVAREIDVVVNPANHSQLLLDSDLNCFGVVGIVLIVDAETGVVVDTRRNCLVC